MNIISEKDIYRLVFKSRRPEAEAFQDWVYETIRELRRASGLEGYEAFKMLDKERNQAAHEKKFYLKSALFGLLGVFLGLLVDFILFG